MASSSIRKDQIAYVTSRAGAIFDEKKRVIEKKYRTPAKSLTEDQKAVAIAEGRFTVDPSRVGHTHYSRGWAEAVSFPEEYGEKFDAEGYRQEINPIIDAYNKLLDELMLGDNATALELLRAFEAK